MVPVMEMTDAPDAAVLAAIQTPLLAYNRARCAVDPKHRFLAITLRDPESMEVIGGLWGVSYFSYLFIEFLVVETRFRGEGWGSRLMAQAEDEARRRECHSMWLDTFDFQARPFYERLGFAVFGTLDEFPPGHQRFFMVKKLAPAT